MRSTRLTVTTLALFFLMLCALGLAAQSGGLRVALVIGNGSYAKIQSLNNPVNDAVDIAAALKRMGFTVLMTTDADRKNMRTRIDDFNKAIQGADVALFYYSGHGVQLDGENYLVPVNAEVEVAGDVADECVPLSRITARMIEAGAGTNVLILDACRDNPFKAVSRGIERGLAVIGQKPPESIIVYATAENEKAEDGTGRNGVFTAALLKNIERKDSFADILLDVKKEVRTATQDKQQPADYNNLTHRVYLSEGASVATAPMQTESAAVPTMSVTRTYGSLLVSAATGGTLYLDGKPMGDLPAGAKATLDTVEVGDRTLELRYADGKVEQKSAEVEEGQAATVSFTYRKAPHPAALPMSTGDSVLVKGGSFTMGSPATEQGRFDNEVQHQVSVSDFYLSKYDVTVGDFRAFVDATGYKTSAELDGGSYVWDGKARNKDASINWHNPGFAQNDQHPVVCMSWYDAVAYCNWKSQSEGRGPAYRYDGEADFKSWPAGWNTEKAINNIACDFSVTGYRLPTEAEWEYAAEGGSAAAGLGVNAVYAGSANLEDVAWYNNNSGGATHPVGQKAPNTLGLYDMAGNVWQWCQDWFADYATSGRQSDPRGPVSGDYRVIRGDSWRYGAAYLRSAYRYGNDPWDRSSGDGFRLVCTQIK